MLKKIIFILPILVATGAFSANQQLINDSPAPFPAMPSCNDLWNLDGAYRVLNATRDVVTLNSIWQFKPASSAAETQVPAQGEEWYYFKVPGIWPTIDGWDRAGTMQIIFLSSGQKAPVDCSKLNDAWYRRTVDIPKNWQGKSIEFEATYIQTCGQLFVNGQKAGELYYPGGIVDITRFARPGENNEIAILVSAKVNAEIAQVFMAPGRIISSKAIFNSRGLPGDIFLSAVPAAPAPLLGDVRLDSSVSKKTLTADVGFRRITNGAYKLQAEIFDGKTLVKSFRSSDFECAADSSRISFTTVWTDPKLWDIDAPQNLYHARISLLKQDGTIIDQLPDEEFGFREFTIKSRDFLLNGKKIHLRSACAMNTKRGAAENTPEFYRGMAERLRMFNINHLIGTNYNFAPGSITFYEIFHRELSRQGILTSLTLPHVSNFKWKLDDPTIAEEYRLQTAHIIRRLQNVPGIVLYAANHNATGYMGDQNPMRIDGKYSPDNILKEIQPHQHSIRKQAMIAAEIARQIDPSRPLYHHESGNLGDLYTLNCYLNWVPRQERSDWFEHWQLKGVKPLFLLEWGMPHVCSWSSFRGPAFIWASDNLQCLWLNEYNAAILGEKAYKQDGNKTDLYRQQEKIITGNKNIHFSNISWFQKNNDVQQVWAYMISDNFPAIRARGISGLLPWDMDVYWANSASNTVAENPDRFHNIKNLGPVPDIFKYRSEYFNNPSSTILFTEAGTAARHCFNPGTGWIAGKTGDFTEKSHNFRPGETVRKSLVILNDYRDIQNVKYSWEIPELKLKHTGEVSIAPGERADIPLEFNIPADLPAEILKINSTVEFSGKPRVTDSFELIILPQPKITLKNKVALFDPEGTTTPLLNKLGIQADDASKEIPRDAGILIVGRSALGKQPYALCQALNNGLKMLVLEQSSSTLYSFGLRGNEQGLREVFPVDNTFAAGMLSNWRGNSTLLPPNLNITDFESQYPSWDWCGYSNSRVWRAGNRGTVASVLIEKPCIGNWRPLLHGGFDLQYAPVLEFKEGNTHIMFSQLDISGRDEVEPQAIDLLGKMLVLLDTSVIPQHVQTFYTGDQRGQDLLNLLKISFAVLSEKERPGCGDLLIIGPGASKNSLASIASSGINILGINLSQDEIDSILPGKLKLTRTTAYSNFVGNIQSVPEFSGISNSELHWRKELTLDFFPTDNLGGCTLKVVRTDNGGRAVFCQLAPWLYPEDEFMYRTTRRRTMCLISRLAHNLGATSASDLVTQLDRKNTYIDGMLNLSKDWIGKADPNDEGRKGGWDKASFIPDKTWRGISVPGMFDLQFTNLKGYDGLFWYRKTFDIPMTIPHGTACKMYIGIVDDESWIWLNDELLGEVTVKTNPDNFWAFERIYYIPSEKLKATDNQLVILANDRQQNGGILSKPNLTWPAAYRLYADMPISEDNPYRYYRW